MDSKLLTIQKFIQKKYTLNIFILSFLLSFYYFSKISLSDVSTFGIFLIALMALSFTKDQSREWRIKDTLKHCYNVEANHKEIRRQLRDIVFYAKKNKTQAISNAQLKKISGLLSTEFMDSIDSEIATLKVINVQLKELKKGNIDNLVLAFEQIDRSFMLIDIYAVDDDSDGNAIKDELERIEKAISTLEKQYMKDYGVLDYAIDNLKYIAISNQ